MDNNIKFNYIQISLLTFSLIVPLIMLESPVWLIALLTFTMFSPLLFGSLAYTTIVYCLYDIARPILYICALVVAIQEKQDFFTIAFYILLALQIVSIVKRFIGTVMLIILTITEKRSKW